MLIGTPFEGLRYGARVLARSPGFTIVAVVTLALGIGGNTTVFSALKAVVLDALRYRDPSRLVTIWENNPRFITSGGRVPVRARTFLEWQQKSRSIQAMAAYERREMDVSVKGEAERIAVVRASGNLFQLLGVQPLFGRTLVPEDDQTGHEEVVVIGYSLCQRHFGSETGAVGSPIAIDGRNHTVVGVMPPDFEFPPEPAISGGVLTVRTRAEAWKPVAFTPFEKQSRGDYNFGVVGRPQPGVSIEQVSAELKAVAAGMRLADPSFYRDCGAAITRLYDDAVAQLRPSMLILFGATGFVLLIACANIASLLLAKAAGRQREIAIRTALGASRPHLITQLLSEAVLLALIGAAAGLFLSLWTVRALATAAPGIPRLGFAAVDGGVLLFNFASALLSALLFGLVPALRLSQSSSHEALRFGAGTPISGGRGGTRVRSMLMSFQIVLSVILLSGAILLIRSFARVLGIDSGFASRNVLTMKISPPAYRYRGQQRAALWRQVEQRLSALPGVRSAGLIDDLPLTAEVRNVSSTVAEGQAPPDKEGSEPSAEYRTVTVGYFRTMGIPLLRGRGFTEGDTRGQPPAAVINTTMAQLFWPGTDPIGKRFKRGGYKENKPWLQVIGVVGNVRQSGIERDPRPQVYRPAGQEPLWEASVAVQAALDPATIVPAVRQAIRELDPAVPVHDVQTMNRVIDRALAPRRLQTMLLAIFATLALSLASAGVYGVISYSVAQRGQEIGVRLALGGQPGDVLRLIVRQGMRLIFVGVGAGVLLAMALTRTLRGFLYGVTPGDPASLLGACLLVCASALLAIYIPARKATRIDPIAALKYE